MDSAGHQLPGRPTESFTHNQLEDPMASGRKRVGFTPEAVLSSSHSQSHTPEEDSPPSGHQTSLQRSDVSHEELAQSVHNALGDLYTEESTRSVQKPRPAIRKALRTPPQFDPSIELDEFDDEKTRSGIEAQKRAAKLSKSVGTYSTLGSRRNSSEMLISMLPHTENTQVPPLQPPIQSGYDSAAVTEDEEPEHMWQAKQLYDKHHIRTASTIRPEDLYHSEALTSGQVTPTHDVEVEDEHVPRPAKFRTGVLGTLLSSNSNHTPAVVSRPTKPTGHGRNPSHGSLTLSGASTAANSPSSSPPQSGSSTPGTSTPRRSWYNRSNNQSVTSVSKLIESSSMLATPAQRDMGHEMEEQYKKIRPGLGKRTKSDNSVTLAFSKRSKRRDDEYKIKIHLAGTLARQNYLRKLCKALMMYGAPTHRLEEYMNMSARVLEIEAQFLFMPGCMIIAFDDSSVHTSEVKLVRTSQGVDLGKLRDVHSIYKDVVHDRIGVEEATPRLEAIISRNPKFKAWLRVPVYGLASATVGPFAFQARPIDLPFCFLLGCLLGWLQLIVAPGNDLISNVFEIGAAVITSFIARGLGSIPGSDGKPLFCFSAMAQSSIALILPGFTVLSASLELQSKQMVAGSVRMVYAIIYSLFLGFGITIGTVIFGMMFKGATSETKCTEPMDSRWYYLFVLGFSLCLMVSEISLPFHTETTWYLSVIVPRSPLWTHFQHILATAANELPVGHQPGQVETNACHDFHRSRGLRNQLSFIAIFQKQRAGEQYARCPCHRYCCQHSSPIWPACRELDP
jgi:uncharacterized membrane protein YjjP (DUF1212 family)